jgi:hypothetical protein
MFPKRFPQIVELPDSLPDPVVEFLEQALTASHVAGTLKYCKHLVCLLEREPEGSEPEDAPQPRKHRVVDQAVVPFGTVGGLDQSFALEFPNQRRTHLIAEGPQLGSGFANCDPCPTAAGGRGELKKVLAFPVSHLVRRTTSVVAGANGS